MAVQFILNMPCFYLQIVMTDYSNSNLFELLKFLYNLRQGKPSVSGREFHFANALKQWLVSFGFYCKMDGIGNLIVSKKKKTHYPIIIDAHIDEVGCVVTGKDANGFFRIEGNALADQLLNSGVTVIKPNGMTYNGICRSNSTQINENDLFKLYFAPDRNSREDIVVEPNDSFTWCNPLVVGENKIVGHGLDNIVGAAICLKLLFTKLKPKEDFAISLSVQEEIGYRGITSVLINNKPDKLIVTDCLSAVPKDKNEDFVGAKYGEGAILVYGSGYNQSLTKEIENRWIAGKIKFSRFVSFHPEPTNAAVVLPYLPNTDTVTLGYPIIEKHSKHEQVNSFDIEQLFNGLKALIYET